MSSDSLKYRNIGVASVQDIIRTGEIRTEGEAIMTIRFFFFFQFETGFYHRRLPKLIATKEGGKSYHNTDTMS